jgi:thioredoxin-dependent peroxiredoxin
MNMRRTSRFSLAAAGVVALAALGATAAPVAAQDVEATPPLEIGAVAPDFALPGATRYGVLREQVNLSDYRGQTVVLAFFFRARSRG